MATYRGWRKRPTHSYNSCCNKTVNIGGTGGNQTSNLAEPRRTFRWLFSLIGRGAGQFSRAELLVLKTASRPHFKYGLNEMKHNQETVSYAGQQTWDPIELTWYDIEQNPDTSLGLYQWIGSVTDLPNVIVAHPAQYKKTATLTMLTGQGLVNESWTMYGTWPEDVDWKGLDYATNDVQLCSAKMRYDRAIRSCVNPGGVIAPTITVGMC